MVLQKSESVCEKERRVTRQTSVVAPQKVCGLSLRARRHWKIEHEPALIPGVRQHTLGGERSIFNGARCTREAQ